MKIERLKFATLLLATLIGLAACKKQESTVLYKRKYIDEIKEARKELSLYLTTATIPGASIAVAKKGEIIYSQGLGFASKDLDVPANRETKFRIGDVSELFTSLTYQLLVNDGTLQPDSSVQYYLPGFPEKESKITLEHLVNHTSGIRKESQSEEKKDNLNINLERGLSVFKDNPLSAPAGMYQEFSAFNYNLLGVIMEKATGKKFDKIVQSTILDTLNLTNTTFDNPYKTIKGRSEFFDHSIVAILTRATSADLRSHAPSKGMLSNAEDLVKFGNALLYSDYIPDATRNKLFLLSQTNPGFKSQSSNSWIIAKDKEGRDLYIRSGYVKGGGAAIVIFPDEELIVAITVNATMDMNEVPIYKIAKYFLPKTEKLQEEAKSESGAQ